MEDPLQPSKEERPRTEKSKVISRRDVFARAGVLGGALAISAAASDQLSDSTVSNLKYLLDPSLEDKKKRLAQEHKNIALVESPNASYAIEYNIHTEPSSVSTLKKSDAVILELIGDYSSPKAVVDSLSGNLNTPGYKEITLQAVEDKKPIFFVDYTFPDDKKVEVNRSFNQNQAHVRAIKFLETILGGTLVLAASLPSQESASPDPGHKMTRRHFLKTAGAIGGVYLLSHVPEKLLSDAAMTNADIKDENATIRKAEKTLGTINVIVHPETRTEEVDMRNTLIAQKAETIAQLLAKELGRKPKIALEIGAAHFGIELELQRAERSRIKSLRRDLGDRFKSQSTIARVQAVDGKWKIEIISDTGMANAE